jgi:exodeoxyribonuclease-3
MKIVSFNINSLRARLHQLDALIKTHQPDIIGLQETKVQDADFPLEDIEARGYHVLFHGQKTHYGVALLSKKPLTATHKGFPSDSEDDQKRLVAGTYDDNGNPVVVINGYFPQGENRNHETKFPAKRKFYADLSVFLRNHYSPSQRLAVMGDFNISPADIDIGIGEENRKRWLREGKTSFLPEEREWFNNLLDWGLIDSYRHQFPSKNDHFSWFDYRSRGFEDDPKRGLRIDGILVTRPMIERQVDAGIDYAIRSMEKPSDHCPIWATFN